MTQLQQSEAKKHAITERQIILSYTFFDQIFKHHVDVRDEYVLCVFAMHTYIYALHVQYISA